MYSTYSPDMASGTVLFTRRRISIFLIRRWGVCADWTFSPLVMWKGPEPFISHAVGERKRWQIFSWKREDFRCVKGGRLFSISIGAFLCLLQPLGYEGLYRANLSFHLNKRTFLIGMRQTRGSVQYFCIVLICIVLVSLCGKFGRWMESNVEMGIGKWRPTYFSIY